MNRVLTGIQSTGVPHLGNLLGAIIPAIELSNKSEEATFLFIADLHTFTQIKDGNLRTQNTLSTAATWLSFGLDPKKNVFYRQSQIPEVTELMWYLLCLFPYSRMSLAHGFKDKADRLDSVNGGLFTYPMLMAADILLYDATFVPVGKDQEQHLEFARDVANKFNAQFGETLVVPQAVIQENTKTVIGIDGQKMSKSRNNTINIFLPDKQLRKQIMAIQTDSLPLEASKKTDSCNVFALYKLLATPQEILQMTNNYKDGGYGYGHAKEALYQLITTKYSKEREKYAFLMENPQNVLNLLKEGEQKARKYARKVLDRVREKIGY